jgi:hypothetical protein
MNFGIISRKSEQDPQGYYGDVDSKDDEMDDDYGKGSGAVLG